MEGRNFRKILLCVFCIICLVLYIVRVTHVIQADAAKRDIFQIGEKFQVGDCLISVTGAEVTTLDRLIDPHREELKENIDYIYQYKVREEQENRAYMIYVDITALSDEAGIYLPDMRFHTEWWFCYPSMFLSALTGSSSLYLNAQKGETKSYVIYCDVIRDYLEDNWKDIDKDDKMLSFTNDPSRFVSVNLGKLAP